jgi:hypothetical protein
MQHSAALVATAALASCQWEDERGVGDAPVGRLHEGPRQVWQNVDQFPNIVAFCIGDNGVYTHTRAAAPIVIANDANCAEGGILAIKEK